MKPLFLPPSLLILVAFTGNLVHGICEEEYPAFSDCVLRNEEACVACDLLPIPNLVEGECGGDFDTFFCNNEGCCDECTAALESLRACKQCTVDCGSGPAPTEAMMTEPPTQAVTTTVPPPTEGMMTDPAPTEAMMTGPVPTEGMMTDPPLEPVTTGEPSDAACDAYPACVEAGVTGNCCPADDGSILGCCNGDTPAPPPTDAAGTDEPSSSCQTLTTQVDFDLTQYIQARWYSQQQRPSPFQPAELNFCTTADYFDIDPTEFGYLDDFSIFVFNTAQDADGNVYTSNDESQVGPDPGPLCGFQELPDADPAKLQVGNCLEGPQGPYWVLEYDEAAGYAIISGGQPTVPTTDGLCTYPSPFNGLWIFTRDPARDEDLIAEATAKIVAQGIDPSTMLPVDQEGCEYPTVPETPPIDSMMSDPPTPAEGAMTEPPTVPETMPTTESMETASPTILASEPPPTEPPTTSAGIACVTGILTLSTTAALAFVLIAV